MQNRSLRNLFDAWKWSEIDVYKLFYSVYNCSAGNTIDMLLTEVYF